MKTIHYVSHSCGLQECDCSPRCHAREGDEIVTSSSVAAVTCKNCLKGLKKDRHPGLPKSKTIAEERDQLKAENEEIKHKVSAGAAREWDLRSQVRAAKESRARVVESNKALRKDASRYRWFRDCGGEWNDVIVLDSHGRIICEELDERIDLAMSKESSHD